MFHYNRSRGRAVRAPAFDTNQTAGRVKPKTFRKLVLYTVSCLALIIKDSVETKLACCVIGKSV